MPKLRLKAPANVVADYFHLFVNRRAYTLQSNRPRPKSARHYYYRPKDRITGQGLSLTPDTIRRHLEGEITIGLYGNAIRGPLGIHRSAGRRFWFDGAEENVEAQMQYLNSVPKVNREQLTRLIAGKSMPPQIVRPKKLWCPGEPEFCILDHINTPLHTVGHNNVTRCPSCAEEGHDRSGDNLSISIENPRKYICWAGCTSDMIRSALGYPRVHVHVQNKEASNVKIWPDSNGLTRREIPSGGPEGDGLRG